MRSSALTPHPVHPHCVTAPKGDSFGFILGIGMMGCGLTGWRSAAASAPKLASKMPAISRAKRSAGTPGWAAVPIECRDEACGRCAATIQPAAFGRTTLTEPHPAQRAFGCIHLETALNGTTRSTTGAHPTRDWFHPNRTALVRQSTVQPCSRTRQLYG